MDGKQIREVTPQGITYLDENGEEQFIDFSVCYENYVRRMTTPQYWERYKQMNHQTDADWGEYVKWVKYWKEVGFRDRGGMFGDGHPYIELHTEPPVRFTFATEEEFGQVWGLARKLGWQMADLS